MFENFDPYMNLKNKAITTVYRVFERAYTVHVKIKKISLFLCKLFGKVEPQILVFFVRFDQIADKNRTNRRTS